MKTYCREIDITEPKLIYGCIMDCVDGKYERKDTIELIRGYTGLTKRDVRNLVKPENRKLLNHVFETVAAGISWEIKNRRISIKPIRYTIRRDPSSNKERELGKECIKQQFLDYVADAGLKPIFKRIGTYQCASIKGRGQSYGIKHIKKWLRNFDLRHAGKADIRKCYESIPQRYILRFLEKHVRNADLLFLVKFLLGTYKKGLSIGSILSKNLCNLILSILYHHLTEHCYTTRIHKDGTVERVPLVSKVIFYMDDILLLGKSAKRMHKAITFMIDYAKDMGLTIKETWSEFKISGIERCRFVGNFIDMMGFRIYRLHVTLRRRIFLKARKTFAEAKKRIRTGKELPVKLARRCISYNGWCKNTNMYIFTKKFKVKDIIIKSKEVISQNEKRKIRFAAACRQSLQAG